MNSELLKTDVIAHDSDYGPAHRLLAHITLDGNWSNALKSLHCVAMHRKRAPQDGFVKHRM